jgi:hypothetical protein
MKDAFITFFNLVNNNSGCLLVILTFVYVIGTLLILFETKKSRISLLRPFINVYFSRKDNLLFLTIENIGNIAGKNLELSFNPSLVTFCKGKKIIRFIPATGRINFLIGETEKFISENSLEYSVEILFFSIVTKKKYKEKFRLDVNEIRDVVQM